MGGSKGKEIDAFVRRRLRKPGGTQRGRGVTDPVLSEACYNRD